MQTTTNNLNTDSSSLQPDSSALQPAVVQIKPPRTGLTPADDNTFRSLTIRNMLFNAPANGAVINLTPDAYKTVVCILNLNGASVTIHVGSTGGCCMGDELLLIFLNASGAAVTFTGSFNIVQSQGQQPAIKNGANLALPNTQGSTASPPPTVTVSGDGNLKFIFDGLQWSAEGLLPTARLQTLTQS